MPVCNGDVIRGPYAACQEAPIDERDIADVAAQALLGCEPVNQRLELTGPESLTKAEMVDLLGYALGRRLHYEDIPPKIAQDLMVKLSMPAGLAIASRTIRTWG